MHDPSNHYDERAIVALSQWGEFIGHLPRDGWLTAAMLDEGKTVEAVIERIARSDGGYLGIVLDVELSASD